MFIKRSVTTQVHQIHVVRLFDQTLREWVGLQQKLDRFGYQLEPGTANSVVLIAYQKNPWDVMGCFEAPGVSLGGFGVSIKGSGLLG